MKWNTRRLAAAAVVLPAVLGVAACGKSESPAPATGQTQASSAATSDAPAAGQPYKDKAAFVDHRARELPTAVLRVLTHRLPCLGLRRVAVEREDPVLVIRHRPPF